MKKTNALLFCLLFFGCNCFRSSKEEIRVLNACVKRLMVEKFEFSSRDSSIIFTLKENPFFEGIPLGGEMLISTRKYDKIGSIYAYHKEDKWKFDGEHKVRIPLTKDVKYLSESTLESASISDIAHDVFVEGDSINYITLRLWSSSVVVMDSITCMNPATTDLAFCRWIHGKRLPIKDISICATIIK